MVGDVRLPAEWTPHSVTVLPYTGEGANGPTWGTLLSFSPTTGNGVYVRDIHELIVDDTGAEVVSSGSVRFSFDDATFGPQSKVTVWEGRPFSREAAVIKVSRFEHPDWPGLAVVYLR